LGMPAPPFYLNWFINQALALWFCRRAACRVCPATSLYIII